MEIYSSEETINSRKDSIIEETAFKDREIERHEKAPEAVRG